MWMFEAKQLDKDASPQAHAQKSNKKKISQQVKSNPKNREWLCGKIDKP